MADYTNRLNVIANIIDPITRTILVYPVKDAYLSEEEPVFPHGIQRMLLVNNSTPTVGRSNKTIMAFDIPQMTDTQYENLISVELILQTTVVPRRDVNIGFKYHIDDGWVEDGTTYLGQPQDEPEFVQMKTLGSLDRVLKYDITDIFTSHENKEFHFPITIMEEDNGVAGTPVMFNSREAGPKLSPVVKISYAYFPEMVDATKIDGKLTVRRNVPNNTEPYPYLPGQLDIWGGVYRAHLDGELTIKTIPVPDPNADPPVEAPELPGSMIIRRRYHSFLNGQLIVRQHKKKELDGRLDVNFYVTRPGAPNIDDPPARLPSDGRWVQPLPIPYLKGSIEIKTFPVPDPTADPPVESPYIEGQLNIRGLKELDGQLTIPRYHADDGGPDYIGPDGTPHKFGPSTTLDGQINIKVKGPEGDIDGQLTIPRYHADDGGPDYVGPDGTPHKFGPSTTLDGQLVVRRNIPNDKEKAPDLDGEIYFRTRKALLNRAIRLQKPNTDELNGNLVINTNKEEFYPADDLEGQFNIRGYTTLNAQISINFHTESTDLDAQLNIPATVDLEGSLVVKQNKDAALDGRFKINGRGFKDMIGSLNIDDGASSSYAFIID